MKKTVLILLVLLSALVLVQPVLAECTAPYFQPDGRMNAWHQCVPLAAYPDGMGGVYIHWAVGEDYHMGDLALWVTAEDIAAVDTTGLGPTEQALVTSGYGIMVYLTGDGYLKIEIPGVYGFDFLAGYLLNEPAAWGTVIIPDAYGNVGFT